MGTGPQNPPDAVTLQLVRDFSATLELVGLRVCVCARTEKEKLGKKVLIIKLGVSDREMQREYGVGGNPTTLPSTW